MLLIIPKSELIPAFFLSPADILDVWPPTRILMCSIRNMGGFPCPRCLIPMESMHLIGTKRDTKQRETLARVDNLTRRENVRSARRLIYESDFAVDCAAVERLLKPHCSVISAH